MDKERDKLIGLTKPKLIPFSSVVLHVFSKLKCFFFLPFLEE